jgi:DNA-binding IscR family transcriptional regulator
MRLTTKGRFAVTAMIDLAMRGERGPGCIGQHQRTAENFLVLS